MTAQLLFNTHFLPKLGSVEQQTQQFERRGKKMNWLVQVATALLVLVVLVATVMIMMRWHRRRRQHQMAMESAARYYGWGKPMYEPQANFLSNMRIVISKFKDQRRQEEYQFAVLFFVQQEIKALKDMYVNCNFNFRNNYRDHQLCNYEATFWPEIDKFYNYMVSRHSDTNHAEEIILDQFLEMWDRFLQLKRGKKPSFVILYSWLMLCSRCTKKLIHLMEDRFKPTQFVVVYTVPAWAGEEEDVAEESREKLLSAQIRVYHVHYDEYLPPGQEPAAAETHQTINLDDKEEFPALI